MGDTPQTLAAITNALAQTFPERFARQMNRTSTTLSVFNVVSSPHNAKNVAWDVLSDGAVGESFTDGADVSNYGSDVMTPALLNWGALRSNFRITNLAAAAAARAQSPAEANDLIGLNFWSAITKIGSTANSQMFSGSGASGQIAGFALAVDASGEYAGIDRASASYWQSYEQDSSGAALTFKHIRDDLAGIYDLSGMVPDIALCSSSMFNKVRGLFDASVKFDRQVTTARGAFVLDNSPEVVVMDGCQFVRDKDATAGGIYYLNSNVVEIEVLPQVQSFASPISSGDTNLDRLMSAFHAYELGRSGSARKLSVEAYLQLKVTQPNACGKRLNIG